MGPQPSNAELVEQARQGSKTAFNALVDRYWSSAVGLARHWDAARALPRRDRAPVRVTRDGLAAGDIRPWIRLAAASGRVPEAPLRVLPAPGTWMNDEAKLVRVLDGD